MDSPSRVFVPSVLEADGNAIGMGCFSTEQIAWEVMKTFLAKSEQMNLEQATIIAWDVDCLLYTSPSPRDATLSRMPSSA